MTDKFLKSRRQGLSPRTIQYYHETLGLANIVIGLKVTSQDIARFLDSLKCANGGKHAYYRALRALYNWLYSTKSGYRFSPAQNPILGVDAPKVEKKILPSLTVEQVSYLIEQAECIRDKAIISLFTESGLRLKELANIRIQDVDWQTRLIKVVCKGNREGLAPFGRRTESLLKQWLLTWHGNKLWNLDYWGIISMLKRLQARTGLPCNPHTFRRTFACLLRKAGVDTMTIKDLGRWESLEMVQRYTRSVSFQDSLKFYKAPLS